MICCLFCCRHPSGAATSYHVTLPPLVLHLIPHTPHTPHTPNTPHTPHTPNIYLDNMNKFEIISCNFVTCKAFTASSIHHGMIHWRLAAPPFRGHRPPSHKPIWRQFVPFHARHGGSMVHRAGVVSLVRGMLLPTNYRIIKMEKYMYLYLPPKHV